MCDNPEFTHQHSELIFFVNGKKVVESDPDPEWTLLFYLRKKLRLTGSKFGCGEGGCGACTVMLSKYDRKNDRVVHMAVNACLTPICSVHGKAITTVEGIGTTKTKIHPVQERIAKAHGSQCGFCTPGIVMSMYTLLRNNVGIQYEDIETALQGNLCRCTGYRPIIEGLKTFIEGWEMKYATNGFQEETHKTCSMGKDCCKNKPAEKMEGSINAATFIPYDPSQEPIFPPELKLDTELDKQSLSFQSSSVFWYRPTNLNELLKIKNDYPNCKIVAGNTEVGVEIKFKKLSYPVVVTPELVEEMNRVTTKENCVEVGASVSLTELQSFFKSLITDGPAYRMKVFEVILEILHWFAGNQIRNVATLSGNIVTASPISDLSPILMSCGAAIIVRSLNNGMRKLLIDENFFIGYRKTAIKPDEVVISVEIPYSNNFQYVRAYKQSKRREDDISIVTGAFNVEIFPDTNVIKSMKMCFGGMGPTTIYAKKTSDVLEGLTWGPEITNKTFVSLLNEIKLDASAPGGMTDYRKSLCLSMFFKFFIEVNGIIDTLKNGWKIQIDGSTTFDNFGKNGPKSSQFYEIVKRNRKQTDFVGKPLMHISAFKQATGEAIYCDDIPTIEGELFLSLVFSSRSHAKVLSVNASQALMLKGVIAFFCADDLKEFNLKGLQGEEVFTSQLLTSFGSVLGAIVAENEIIARKAVQLVKIKYEDKGSPIITIEDAIKHRSYYPGYPKAMVKGDIQKAFQESDFVIEGHSRNGAQEHFYMETQNCLAIPKEDEMEICVSSQHPHQVVALVSRVLDIPIHKVCAKVKRIGGGFGGKETRAATLFLPVAIAAHKLNRPVRAVLDRDEDMQLTGHRHPHLIKYKVAFNTNGRIMGALYDIYNNAGCSLDVSDSVAEAAAFHIDNCYYVPNVHVNRYVCKTDLPSNTSFRGFGKPQAMLATETMIRDVANHLGKPFEEILLLNMYKEGDLTHYDQPLLYCTVRRCWEECVKMSDYFRRKADIEVFNRENRWKKKGISIVPTKFGVSFGIDKLMQGGALVHIYTDGSVLITIGGIEMGQGLFTKMIQVASRVLEVDVSKIHISETSTDKVPNATSTAASVSSDLYGMAVLNACTTLLKRLEPYKNKNLEGDWEDWVSQAYVDRVSLSATGFYAAPKITYNPETNSGDKHNYFTYGVGCSEVLIDCLTGDHVVMRTDIVMDLGESLNPAIDIGQVEGAFMQGYGFCTMEELIYSPNGALYSKGPGAYKIPGFGDIPREFNVSLLRGAPNPRAIYSSKAVGEPPLFLASSVFFAIKEAISSARRDSGAEPHFHLDAPATCARIRMACVDEITSIVGQLERDGESPWNVMA